jgi:hypothetical protein
MYMDIKPRPATGLDSWSYWLNDMTSRLVSDSYARKNIEIKTGNQIPVKTDIFHGYGWKIDVKTPTKELYKRTYGENWGFHYQIYMAWNSRKY